MILACPACGTKYTVPDNSIGENGREVRCAKCGHEWFVTPTAEGDIFAAPEEEAAEPEAELEFAMAEEADEESAGEEASEDAEQPEEDADDLSDIAYEELEQRLQAAAKKSGSAAGNGQGGNGLWIAGFVILLLAATGLSLLVYRETLAGPLGPLYRAFGFYPTDGVVLQEASLEIPPSRRKKRYILHCKVVNTSEEPRYLPQMHIQIVSEHGVTIAEDDDFLDAGLKELQPGEVFDCGDPEFTSPSDSAVKMIINLGSPLELSLRDAE